MAVKKLINCGDRYIKNAVSNNSNVKDTYKQRRNKIWEGGVVKYTISIQRGEAPLNLLSYCKAH